MAPLDEEAFRSRLRGLSRAELTAFVAALWAARGRDVDRKDGLVVATDPATGEETVLRPIPARRGDRILGAREPPRSEATAIVLGGARAPSWTEDRRIIDAADLHELLSYAVDRETSRALFEEFFDVDPAELADGSTTSDEPDTTGDPSDDLAATGLSVPGSARSVGAVAVALLVLLSTLAGVLVLGVGPLELPGASDEDPSDGTNATTPTDAQTRTGGPYPPGLSSSGVTDADALAAAHVTNLSGYTYTMQFQYREVGPNHTGTIRETTEVVADTRYARHVNRTGSFVSDPATITDPAVVRNAETFANGQFHYERRLTPEGIRYNRRGVYAGRFPIHDARAAGFVQRTLAAEETEVTARFERNGRTFYRVRFSGDDRPAFEDVRGEALIDERGVVHLLRVRYQPADHPSVTATVILRYTDVRTTELTEPDWISKVPNESRPSNGSAPAVGW